MTNTTPTISTVLADAKRLGYAVTKAAVKVNGQTVYRISGYGGFYTKDGIMSLIY